MNINESIRDWLEYKQPLFSSLSGLDIVTMGETGDLDPPFLGIMESGSAIYEQGETTLYGVTTYEVTCELHTVPADSDQEGTPTATEQQMRADIHDILANRAAIDWINGLNVWQVFDIRTAAPMTEAQDGRRVSRWVLTVIAAPL